MKVLNRVMMVMFSGFIALQLNDPDPWVWAAIYLVPLVVCVCWEMGRLSRVLPALTALVAVGGAIWIMGVSSCESDLSLVLGDWAMERVGSETLREAGGLVLVAVWMAVLAVNFQTEHQI